MSECADRNGWVLIPSDDPERQRFVESLGHVGLGTVCEGDPTPEERIAEGAEMMAAGEHRGLMLYLQNRAHQDEDGGELEALRRHLRRERDEAMEQFRVLLFCQSRRRNTQPLRHARSRTSRGGCARRRGSRRSTGAGSRTGPSDDNGESDPGDDHFPLVAGDTAGGRRA
jgi:hypothetical protein